MLTCETLALLGHGTVSVSKTRSETLAVGEKALKALNHPASNVRQYADAQLEVHDGEIPRVTRPVENLLLLFPSPEKTASVRQQVFRIRNPSALSFNEITTWREFMV